jgi:hypothetical protein
MLRRLLAGAFLLGAIFLVLWLLSMCAVPVRAHDSWISRGGLRNPFTNDWCCGEGDCGVMVSGMISAGRDGYSLDANFEIGSGEGAIREHIREFVPYSESQPSPDGAVWRCKRSDGTRRCFFAPPPNT